MWKKLFKFNNYVQLKELNIDFVEFFGKRSKTITKITSVISLHSKKYLDPISMTNADIKDNKSVLKTVFYLKLFQEKEHRRAQTVFSYEGKKEWNRSRHKKAS